MKDIERIQSTELAVQVQDANPANFAIEQEVAQLVGATVPAPTEPSADDARELGAQLLVFLWRALLPIRSALRTAVAAIYAHLDSRCTAYTPAAYAPYLPLPSYDPMGPFVPRTLPNLLTALTAFSARKISNGSAPNDGIPDGTSLARLLGSTDLAAITEIKDDTPGWVMDRLLPTMNGVTKATLGMSKANIRIDTCIPNCTELHLTDCEDGGYSVRSSLGYQSFIGGQNGALYLDVLDAPRLKYTNGISLLGSPEELTLPSLETTIKTENEYTFMLPTTKKLYLPEFDRIGYIGNATWIYAPILEELYMPKCRGVQSKAGWPTLISASETLQRIVFGKLDYNLRQSDADVSILSLGNATNLIDIEFGEGTAVDLLLSSWNPTNVLSDADKTATFLQNFREHIALRLTDQGSGLTLTLSQAVFDTIWNADGTPKSTDPDSVIYQINKIIKTDKHWSVNRA